MNIQSNFDGSGIRQAFSEPDRPAQSEGIGQGGMTEAEIAAMEETADLIDEALSQPLPAPTGTEKDRLVFERSIAARRAEKAKQQAIAAAAMAKARQITASIRSMEDALDSLLVSES